MQDRIFLDTNIFIYAYSKTEPEKRKIALELLCLNKALISTQIINEFVWVMYRKFKVDRRKLQVVGNKLLEKFEIVLINLETIRKALNIFVDYNFSFWDSLIIASALENDCSILYTEDMQHGQIIEERLKIVNPFVGRS